MKLPINKIICGDCLEVMKDWPDNCVDLILTDPPYNIGTDYGDTTKSNRSMNEYYNWCRSWFCECRRICRYNVLIFTGNDNYFYWICHIKRPSELVIWYRSNSMVRNKYMYSWRKIEPIYFWEKERNIKTFHDYYDIPISIQKEADGHPTPKPLRLFNMLLKDFSFPGNIILDLFVGSGTTCIAAKILGRRYIGIDISEKYCEISRKRLKGVRPSLFEKPKSKIESASFGLKTKSKRKTNK